MGIAQCFYLELELLIVLNGIEIWLCYPLFDVQDLLIVLNGIEIRKVTHICGK